MNAARDRPRRHSGVSLMTDLQITYAALQSAEDVSVVASAAFILRKNMNTRQAMKDARNASQYACNAYMAACIAAGHNFMVAP